MTQRSTSGVHLAFHGGQSIFRRQGDSQKQDAVAFSTLEAEVYAGRAGYRKVTILALVLWDVIAPQMTIPMFHEDNQAMIMVVMSGRNPTMRHLGRVHRVSVSWLHERLGKHPDNDGTILFYDDTHNMSADIYTKAFPSPENWSHALHLINIFRPEDVNPTFLSEWMSSRA